MDACVIDRSDDGHAISGTALFVAGGVPAKIDYRVFCDTDWCSKSAQVRGWIGTEIKTIDVLRSSHGVWTVNGENIAGVDGLLDIDLGFTPATNTNAIRRLRLESGVTVKTTAFWLDLEDWTFKPLQQTYRRISENVLIYSSPSHDYHAELAVDEFGIIQSYPDLWEAISCTSASTLQ